jgi:pheromone shutdown-related protein TraB
MPEADKSQIIHRLQWQDKEVILLGTAHVSRESAETAADVIRSEQPDTVCVELCPSRYQALRQQDRWKETDIIKVVKEKKAFLLLSNLMLASFQKRVAAKLDIQPGQEMITAIETAEAVGARIHLADRDIRVTLSRTWRSMGIWSKIKLLAQLVVSLSDVDDISEADIERMKQEDILESLLSEVEKSMPVVRRILIDERDRYLSRKIREAPGKKIVAVVGAGHVPGIKRHWMEDVNLGDLESLPEKSRLIGFFKWAIPLCILALLVAGFFYGGADTGTHMLTWWVAANGLLAGVGALLALGHPLTILSSVLAAPLTSLNPMVAAGWVSGLVEAFSSRPKVKDFETLQQDIRSVRGFWRNKVTRILLVVVFTNLGSTLGTMVAVPLLVRML